ncbi:hypothetical protein M9H77_22905 [Catharanthus roseus]|uniref:Uncharacterized protein n=1 Tax=Catharanthus roseus TaxID=4058 RepID=A0ACC0ARE6_CATRO|nr:hypothetical protein M9H77_22905 [Catharanthus roseus]
MSLSDLRDRGSSIFSPKLPELILLYEFLYNRDVVNTSAWPSREFDGDFPHPPLPDYLRQTSPPLPPLPLPPSSTNPTVDAHAKPNLGISSQIKLTFLVCSSSILLDIALVTGCNNFIVSCASWVIQPHHGMDLGIQIQSFYNGVSFGARHLIDASAGGSITMNSYTSEDREPSPNLSGSLDHDDTCSMIDAIDPHISTLVWEFVQEDALLIAL